MKKEEESKEKDLKKIMLLLVVLSIITAILSVIAVKKKQERIYKLEGQLDNQADLIVGLERSIERLAYGLGKNSRR